MDNLNKTILVLAAIGIPDAAYHAYDEITSYSSRVSQVCDINNFLSCRNVFDSGYTTFAGISLWVYGIVWFPLILVVAYWFIRKKGRVNAYVMLPLLMVGNAFTVYLWYLELGVIHALCPVCISLYSLNYLMTAACLAIALRES